MEIQSGIIVLLVLLLENSPNHGLVTNFSCRDFNTSSIEKPPSEINLSNCEIKELPVFPFHNFNDVQHLDLSNNDIEVIPEITFRSTNKLTTLSLKNNKINSLQNSTFAYLQRLELLDLSVNSLRLISKEIFSNLPNLVELNLNYNKIISIERGSFSRNLLNLHLSANRIGDWLNEEMLPSNNLKYLDLSYNQLTTITKELLRNLPKLTELNLNRNRISTIGNEAFGQMQSLEMVYLNNNNLSLAENRDFGIFKNCSNLTYVDLAYNALRCPFHQDLINNVTFEFNDVKYRDVPLPACVTHAIDSQQSYVTIYSLYMNKSALYVKNGYNQTLNTPTINVDVSGNPFHCECYHNLVRAFHINNDYNSICSVQQVQDFKNICPDKCYCTCNFNTQSFVVDCSYKKFENAPKLLSRGVTFNKTLIHLEGNLLIHGPSQGMGYENVTDLYLSNNRIEQLEWIPPNIRNLRLDHNNIKRLSTETLIKLQDSDALSNLWLNNNSWICDCNTTDFINFLHETSKLINTGRLFCSNDNRELITLTKDDLCDVGYMKSIIQALIITTLTILLLSFILIACYLKYKLEIKVWLYAHDTCLHWITEDDMDRDKLYDIFLCYSYKDEEFVARVLVPELERGPDPYKLCIHVRDWIPGRLIAKQIVRSISQSRRTLVVLSSNFLKSNWGKTEFHYAHSLSMNEGSRRVVVVMYGDIHVTNDIDEDIKAYINTYTYIKWGHPRFWENLKYALPHKKGKLRTQNNGELDTL